MAIITLTGPTCAGKSTVEAALQTLAGFGRAISHTTRPMRAGEVNGSAYHFVSDEEFRNLRLAGKFVETIEFGSYKYAMSAEALQKAQTDSAHVVIVVEPLGAEQIHVFCKDRGMESIGIWIDCKASDQAKRWLDRLTSDMLIGKSSLDPYVDRLGLMLAEEAQWRRDAYSAYTQPYDMMFNSSELTAEEIAKRIQHYAD